MRDNEIDSKVAALGAVQHALVTCRQTVDLGLTKRQRQHRIETGRLVPCETNVLRIGGAPVTWPQRVLASCLAADGVASHRTAAMLEGSGYGRARSSRCSSTRIGAIAPTERK